MNLTEQQITDALRGTDYENSHYDSSAINYCRQNAAKVILLEGVVRDLVTRLESIADVVAECDLPKLAAEIRASAALQQAKLIMGEE